MRAILLILFAVTSSFAQDVDWLVGKWTRTNAKPGCSGIEIWIKKSSGELTGRGISLTGSDTTFVENLRIVAKDGKLFYVADVPENSSETWFEFTNMTDKSFACENPTHDFPKKITYNLEDNELKATISGNGKSIEYLFVREK